MRRSAGLLAVALLAAAALPGTAAQRPGAPGPGYFATDNVSYVGTIPLNTDSAGARIVGKTLYVTDDRGLTTYDISTPTRPVPLGFLPLPQTPYFPEEDVDTNGKTLLVSTLNDLYVIDVRDPKLPKVTTTVPGAEAHTVSCVLDCSYSYASHGPIVDLKHPEGAQIVGDWTIGMPARSAHDVTEVSPGIVLTSSNPMLLLDARRTPWKPTLLATASPGDPRFIHGNLWPRRGADRFVLAGGETRGSCDETAGGFMVFDTTDWKRTKKFRMTDDHHLTTGLPTDGNSPYDQWCAHWFSEHPRFRNGGLVAMGWYEHGTRFLNVTPQGKIEEVGYFLPLAGSTSAAYWVDDTVVYVVDYQRGIDILTFSGKPATKTVGVGTGDLRLRALPPPGPVEKPTSYVCPLPAA